MTRVEIETITEAMAKKQTWVRKELNDFLDVWAEITKEPISGHNTFVLYEYTPDGSYPVTNRLCLRRGIAEIDGDAYLDGWCPFDNYLQVDDMSMGRARKIIKAINTGLAGYFKAIQADIGNLDETGMEISVIIEKLK